ncbi:MAG: phosphoribosylanthranilate isomerase [Rhodospirillales bacterium]|nr:phosphoribosylanthranilate isomerase [Rhodospirillales bacterium]
MPVDVKICGLSSEEAVEAAVKGGARYVGVVFFPPSPRYVRPGQAGELLDSVPEGVGRVGLFVNPGNDDLAEVLSSMRLDLIQLHGKESPERVDAIRQEFGVPVMKAIAVSGARDIEAAHAYEEAADWLLFDAKPPKTATRPGGNALAFDWELLGGSSFKLPWMLAGGLDATNLAEAVRLSGAKTVDVSSGVEDRPGHKNLGKVDEFLRVAHDV